MSRVRGLGGLGKGFRVSASAAKTAARASAAALTAFSGNQRGSYMAGSGPIAGRST